MTDKGTTTPSPLDTTPPDLMIGLPENERLDLFTLDAVAEIAEGAAQGKAPLIFRLEWDDQVGANIIVGVERWEGILDTEEVLDKQ